jgi:pimeloyl-ACP methyl ester carboxylesterase
MSGLAVVLFPLSGAARQLADPHNYPPAGKLVDVGGWRIHVNCTGRNIRNSPTVVLESGSGDFSFDWSLVQSGVARFTRVCSYDRAGHAWSDLGPRPRTMKQIAHELHTALVKLGIKSPYVLAGQSVGGLLIRTFASQYPKEVAGMVLVDSTHEDTQLYLNGKIQRMRELSQGRAIPPIQTAISASDRSLSIEERQQIEGFLKQQGPPKIEPPFNRLPAEIQKIRLWAIAQPQHYAADNDPYWGEEFAEIYAARKMGEYPLGDIPLTVLTRGISEYPDTEAGKQLEEERKRMQLDLLRLSRNSKQIISRTSGHHIQLDDPGLVIDAIRGVTDSARRRKPTLSH